MASPRRRWARRGVSLVVLLGCLLGAEALAELHDGDTWFPADGRRFATVAGTHGTNPEGFHERALTEAPAAGTRRIVVLGDSMTWGTASAEEAWPRVMERALGAPWQAVNLSHYGYDAEQAHATLRAFGWRYAPELVIFGSYGNDLVPSELITVGEPPFFAWVGSRGWLPEGVRQRSALARLAEGAVRARGFVESEAPERYSAALLAMRDESAARNVPFVVVELVPHVLADPDPARCDARAQLPGRCEAALAQAERLAAEVRRSGVPWVDALPLLRSGPERAWFNAGSQDWEHPSPAGHAWLGAGIAQELRGAGLLPE